MCSRGIFLLCWKQQQQRWYFEKVRNHTLHSASGQTNQRMQYRDSIYMPLNLHTCEAAVTFMDRSWFPHLQVALWMAAAAPACFSALYAIGAICSAMNQRLVNFYGSVVTFFSSCFSASHHIDPERGKARGKSTASCATSYIRKLK